jgi:hypothetical protein
MTTTRERLGRRRHRGATIAIVVSSVLVVVLTAGAGIALWLLPPVLAETPRERFESATRVAVSDEAGSASLEFETGWLGIGVGPFLPTEAATVVSPDDVYRAQLSLAPAAAFDGDALLTSLGLAAAPTGFPTAAAAPATPPVATAPPAWSTETLATGVIVHHTEIVTDDRTRVVAQVDPPAAAPGAAPTPPLVLVATVPSDVAPAYRTVTADLLATAAFAPPGTTTPPTTPAAAAVLDARPATDGARS